MLNRNIIIISLLAAAVLALVILVWFAVFREQQTQEPPQQTGQQPQEKIIVRQDEVHGLSGIIRSVDVETSSFVMETSALPYAEFRPQAGEKWLWTVAVQDDTELALLVPDEEAEDEEHEGEHFRRRQMALQDIVEGNVAIVEAKDDVTPQFSLNNKQIQAKQVEVYQHIVTR